MEEADGNVGDLVAVGSLALVGIDEYEKEGKSAPTGSMDSNRTSPRTVK